MQGEMNGKKICDIENVGAPNTHGVEGGVEGEKEGRNAVAETADEKKQVCLWAGKSKQ